MGKIQILINKEKIVNCEYCQRLEKEQDLVQVRNHAETWDNICSKCMDDYERNSDDTRDTR